MLYERSRLSRCRRAAELRAGRNLDELHKINTEVADLQNFSPEQKPSSYHSRDA